MNIGIKLTNVLKYIKMTYNPRKFNAAFINKNCPFIYTSSVSTHPMKSYFFNTHTDQSLTLKFALRGDCKPYPLKCSLLRF